MDNFSLDITAETDRLRAAMGIVFTYQGAERANFWSTKDIDGKKTLVLYSGDIREAEKTIEMLPVGMESEQAADLAAAWVEDQVVEPPDISDGDVGIGFRLLAGDALDRLENDWRIICGIQAVSALYGK